ncbi:MAG: monovalent cation:H+ antiporter, CPA1 (nhx1) [Thelocarpon impressellum]|nr:MAG: monovalent cation:H+ antiporter, CPA1 (nhx1) [Thelocarpon impressellum]
MAAATVGSAVFELLRREVDDADGEEPGEVGQKEKFSSWALFILITLLILALFSSYILQQKRIQAVHETVISIFAGMVVGLVIRLTSGSSIQDSVSFDYQFFFNLLLPPIILASGYELHQANFFRNIGTILTFAFAGTFISAVVLGLIIYLWTRMQIEGLDVTFVEAISVGATLSATDPVTILAIFTTYKVDPKLYIIIFGESILNDAIAIVLFETAQRHKASGAGLSPLGLLEGVGNFLLLFFGSLLIGVAVGISTALALKYTRVRQVPKIESCLIILIAYASYFFSNGLELSGIVSLLFCGITLKHYAYYNMSRRTQLTTKYLFQVLSQLSENFIFIYLGLSLFTGKNMDFRPFFIIVTMFGICAARWAAVFPLSKAINWFIRYRARRRGKEVADELPFAYQAMLFWAGLRGAVGVALAASLQGPNSHALRATVLVVVVLTVIIFGGTTARMLEILGIRTGVVEEIDSDDEFDIETVAAGGTYYKRFGTGVGHTPRPGNQVVPLSPVEGRGGDGGARERGGYTTGNASPPMRPNSAMAARKGSNRSGREGEAAAQKLMGRGGESDEDALGSDESDLPPPAARRSPRRLASPRNGGVSPSGYPTSGSSGQAEAGGGDGHLTARGAITQLLSGNVEDQAAWFRQLDEGFIKPKLLLDQHQGGGGGGGGGGGSGSGSGSGSGGGGGGGSPSGQSGG